MPLKSSKQKKPKPTSQASSDTNGSGAAIATDQEIQAQLTAQGVPTQHLKDALSITKQRMDKKSCSLQDAVAFTMQWVNRAKINW